MRTQDKDIQQRLTPARALEILEQGNRRFVNNLRANRNLLQQVNETAEGQYPFAIVLSCIDSRTSAELIFDQGLGDIFSVRVAGNVLNEDILGSMEFACNIAGSKLIVVLGHSKCGAIKGACAHVEMGHLTGLLDKVQPAVARVRDRFNDELTQAQLVEEVALENTRHQMEQILERSPILHGLFDKGRIGIAGAMYSVDTGEVTFFEKRLHESDAADADAAAVVH